MPQLDRGSDSLLGLGTGLGVKHAWNLCSDYGKVGRARRTRRSTSIPLPSFYKYARHWHVRVQGICTMTLSRRPCFYPHFTDEANWSLAHFLKLKFKQGHCQYMAELRLECEFDSKARLQLYEHCPHHLERDQDSDSCLYSTYKAEK